MSSEGGDWETWRLECVHVETVAVTQIPSTYHGKKNIWGIDKRSSFKGGSLNFPLPPLSAYFSYLDPLAEKDLVKEWR